MPYIAFRSIQERGYLFSFELLDFLELEFVFALHDYHQFHLRQNHK